MTSSEEPRSPLGVEPISRQNRRPVALPGFALFKDGTTVGLTVADLSYDGCKVECPVVMTPGIRLKMSVLRLGALDAEVVWCENGFAGLRFNPEEKVSRSETPRHHERVALTGTISLRRAGRQNYQARIFDLSPSGCRVEFVERPKEGETLFVKFDGLDSLEGTVRWVDGFYGGIEFVRPIYSVVFDLLLARLGLS